METADPIKRKVVFAGEPSCTLYCADSRELLPTFATGSVDMIFTDPPYGHNNNDGDLIHNREKALGRSTDQQEARPILGDGFDEANELVTLLFAEAARLLRHGGCCCCCCGGGGGGPDPQFARWSLWMDEALEFKQMVVWDKGPMGMGWHYRRSYETVLVGMKRGGRCRWFDTTKRVENIIRDIPKIIPQAGDHPTVKPTALVSRFIRWHSQRGDVVLDPFMGEGTTGRAATFLRRRFIGIEADRAIFQRAAEAIRQAREEAGNQFDFNRLPFEEPVRDEPRSLFESMPTGAPEQIPEAPNVAPNDPMTPNPFGQEDF